MTWRRQKYEPKGGPQGGDGGRGGDVVLAADEGVNTLLDFRGRPLWSAENGENGMKKQQHGRDGRDCVIKLPAGTLVYSNATGELLLDLAPGQRHVIARGGNGGFGNEHYKTATNQAPTFAHPGFDGQEVELRLELKLIADVGLVGMPNAGKSTLLAALTKATPKIADYPFTTLAPQLGVAELDPTRRLVIADIPGLIEGASEGAGLGLDFLRHVERTRVLVHLLDVQPPDGSSPAENYRKIRRELYNYSPVLAERDEIIVLNKLDLLGGEPERRSAVAGLRAALKLGRGTEVLGLSGATRWGTRELLEHLWREVRGVETRWASDAASGAKAAGTEPTAPVAQAKPAPKASKSKPPAGGGRRARVSKATSRTVGKGGASTAAKRPAKRAAKPAGKAAKVAKPARGGKAAGAGGAGGAGVAKGGPRARVVSPRGRAVSRRA